MGHVFLRHRAAGHQRRAAGQVVGGALHLTLQALQLGLALADLRGQRGITGIQRAGLAHRLRQLRLGVGAGQPRIGGVQPQQRLAGLHHVGIVGQDGHHGAAHLRRDLHHVALHVGVVGGFNLAQRQRPVQAVAGAGQQHHGGDGGQRLAAPERGNVGRVGSGRNVGHGRSREIAE